MLESFRARQQARHQTPQMEYFRIPVSWTMPGFFCLVLFVVNQYELVFQSLHIFQGMLILFLWARSILKILGKSSQWQVHMKNKLTATKSMWSLWVLHSAGVRDELSETWIWISRILMCPMAHVSPPLESSRAYPHPFLHALSALHSHKTQ